MDTNTIWSNDSLIQEIAECLYEKKVNLLYTINGLRFFIIDPTTGSQYVADSGEGLMEWLQSNYQDVGRLDELILSEHFSELLERFKKGMTTLIIEFGVVKVFVPERLVQSQHPINSDQELEAFEADPELFFAKMHGVTKEKYLAWREYQMGDQVRCDATTKKGHRCRNVMSAPYPPLSATEYDPNVPVYCTTHSDHSMNVAKR